MSFIGIVATFLLTFFFLFIFEQLFNFVNVPKVFFGKLLRNKLPYISRFIIAIGLIALTECFVQLSGDSFYIDVLETNVLRIFGISFLFSFITHYEH